MNDWLTERAQKSPDRTALIVDGQIWSFAELDHLVRKYAGHLYAYGVRPGDHIAALMPNSLEYICLIYALMRLQAVLVPLNMRLTVSELRQQLAHSGSAILVCSRDSADKANQLADGSWKVLSAHQSNSPSIQSLQLAEPTPDYEAPPFDPEALQSIIFTSGTSGKPKAVMLTYSNHFWSAIASAFRLGLHKNDQWLSCLPLYHVGGLALIFRSCLYGTTVVLHRNFNASAIQKDLNAGHITLISLVPTMLYWLLTIDIDWKRSLRLVLLGGAAADKELLLQCREKNIPIATTYGLTEAASQVATMLPEDTHDKPGSVGKPLMFVSVKIVDEKGNALEAGRFGEIVVAGKTVMAGYYNDPESTNQALKNGELHTGDIGCLDEDGDLWILQRRDDLIISGGENIYPAEIEGVLKQHPLVKDACVVGIDHAEWGGQVAALIQLYPDRTISKDNLVAFSRERLAGYKQPRVIHFIHALPQTASGKIDRNRVREILRNLIT